MSHKVILTSQRIIQKMCTYCFVWYFSCNEVRFLPSYPFPYTKGYICIYVKYRKVLFSRSQLTFLKHIFTKGCIEEIKTQQCFLLSSAKYYFEQAIKNKLSTTCFVFFFKLSNNYLIAFRKRFPAWITYYTEKILNTQYLFETYHNT